MNLPGFRLHPLKGDLTDDWAVNVSGNWRISRDAPSLRYPIDPQPPESPQCTYRARHRLPRESESFRPSIGLILP